MIELLWEYQNVDMALDKCEAERKSSPLRQKLIKLKNYMVEQQETLIKLNEQAEKKNRIYDRINHEYENIVNNVRADQKRIQDGAISSVKQLEQMEKNVEAWLEKIDKKEQELMKLLDELNDLGQKLKEIRMHVTKAKKEYTDVKAVYDREMEEFQAKYQQLKDKKDSLESRIDKALIAKYRNLKANRTTALAPVIDGRCGGCNMTLASLVVQNVTDGNRIVECENCGRILCAEINKTVS